MQGNREKADNYANRIAEAVWHDKANVAAGRIRKAGDLTDLRLGNELQAIGKEFVNLFEDDRIEIVDLMAEQLDYDWFKLRQLFNAGDNGTLAELSQEMESLYLALSPKV